jgi:hypothetical protein
VETAGYLEVLRHVCTARFRDIRFVEVGGLSVDLKTSPKTGVDR